MMKRLLSLWLLAAAKLSDSDGAWDPNRESFDNLCITVMTLTNFDSTVNYFETDNGMDSEWPKVLVPFMDAYGSIFGGYRWDKADNYGRTQKIRHSGISYECAEGTTPDASFRSYSMVSMLDDPSKADYKRVHPDSRCIMFLHKVPGVWNNRPGYYVYHGKIDELELMKEHGTPERYTILRREEHSIWRLRHRDMWAHWTDEGVVSLCTDWNSLGTHWDNCPTDMGNVLQRRRAAISARLQGCREFLLAKTTFEGAESPVYDVYQAEQVPFEPGLVPFGRKWIISKREGGNYSPAVGYVEARRYKNGTQFLFNMNGLFGRSLEDSLKTPAGDVLCPREFAPVLFEDFRRDFQILRGDYFD